MVLDAAKAVDKVQCSNSKWGVFSTLYIIKCNVCETKVVFNYKWYNIRLV